MIKSVSRTDLVKRMANDLGLTIKQTLEITEAAEEAIYEFLRDREQVRIHEFGTFYQTMIKSHVIKTINTKIPRIVLEQKTLKFRPSPILKDAVYGRTKKPKAQVTQETVPCEPAEILIKKMPTKSGNIAVNYQPTPPKPKTNVSFKTFHFLPRVEKEDIQQKIKDRWLKLAKGKVDEYPQYQIAREAQIFSRLLLRIKNSSINSVDFSFEKSPDIKIFAGRPRHQVSHLPREVVKGFLTYLDLEDFHIPQERYKLIFVDETKYDKISVTVHSFPTDSGSSIHIDIK